jgi:pimeloyl-ACP methyl ester carboxylesterase
MKKSAFSLIAPVVILICCANLGVAQSSPAGQVVVPVKVHVNGVDLHYIERGKGAPLILLHGGQGDYRSWSAQIEALSPHYRVICYSRRYNYPNDNPLTEQYRSAYTDADDLAALIRHLKLGTVDLVGTSAGATTALVLAIQHRIMVRSMVLAEPSAHRLAASRTGSGRKTLDFEMRFRCCCPYN